MRSTRSIRTRLLLALLAVTLVTLVVSTALSALLSVRILHQGALRDLDVLAAVVGGNSISALVFNSPDTAREHLATLAAEPQVWQAVLYDAAGRPFATWQRPASTELRGPAVQREHGLVFDGASIGRIALSARLDELRRQTTRYLALSGVLALATLALALLVALRLQRRIAAPILDLAGKARQLSAAQELRLDAPPRGRVAELDTLIDAFDAMLAGIADREQHIEDQAAALRDANTQLRTLAVDLTLLEQSEKRRLATRLHDSPMQKLALALMQLEQGRAEQDAEGEQMTDTGLTLLREAIGELRTLQFELNPPVLDQSGLAAALEWLAVRMSARSGVTIAWQLLGPAGEQQPPALEHASSVTLFQCARELVYNLIKHAGARRAQVALAWDGQSVTLTVSDDGQGFPRASTPSPPSAAADLGQPGEPRGGFGLYAIRERVALLDGTLSIHSGPQGTRISIRLPRRPGHRSP